MNILTYGHMNNKIVYFSRPNNYDYSIHPVINNKDVAYIDEENILAYSFINRSEIDFTNFNPSELRAKFFVNTGIINANVLDINVDHAFIGKNAEFDEDIFLNANIIIMEEGAKLNDNFIGKVKFVNNEEFENYILKLEEDNKIYLEKLASELTAQTIGHNKRANENEITSVKYDINTGKNIENIILEENANFTDIYV